MKKIIFVLMFSLGLVSVANAESVCNSYSPKSDEMPFSIGKYMSDSDFAMGNGKVEKDWDKLAMRYHSAEIKKNDKETLCIYMVTIGQGYLNIQLTPQEIERFERFLVEKVDESGYEVYEENKDSYLKALKFFKYYNKLDLLYNKKHIKIGIYNSDGSDNNLAIVVKGLKFYENTAYVIIKRFVYGKNMGDYLPDWVGNGATLPRSIKELKEMDNQDAKNIAKWAESKLKESK